MQRKISTLVGIIIIIVVAVVLFGGVFAYQYFGQTKVPATTESGQKLIGGDKDSHGCLIAAGYSWCEAKQKCLRVWEEPCEGVWWYDQNLNMCRQKALTWNDKTASLGYYKTSNDCKNANVQPPKTAK